MNMPRYKRANGTNAARKAGKRKKKFPELRTKPLRSERSGPHSS
jgi:hypothetical protein